jgi:thiol:disulfide interchange protein DsbD
VKNALLYSLFIILIYGVPATLLTLIFGDTSLYKISVNPVTNLLFFAIFIAFALSFFGLFEITLPSSWSTQTDKLASRKGYLGIFFMALTLVIVSFSCTGIVAGQLLSYLSSEGLSAGPIAGMFGFGIGIALPFTLLALFPSLIHSMPKSGGWLNTVKVTFAFIELGLALKFLSNVDLIYHWRLLDREVFIALWIVIAVLLGLYLLGKLKFYHDSEVKHINMLRLFSAIAAFAFALYMLPGMWGAPLKALSAWIPPEYTQDFNLYHPQSSSNTIVADNANAAIPPKKFADKISAPFGLKAYFDLDEGIAAAKILHKPIMLDFTGYSCANCRKMEAEVWSDPEVLKRISNNFVLVSLYVDEPTELPSNEQYKNAKGEDITNYGAKHLDYEISKFGFNAQPLYMFMDADQNVLSDIKYGYDPDVDKFIHHLDDVKTKFESASPKQ